MVIAINLSWTFDQYLCFLHGQIHNVVDIVCKFSTFCLEQAFSSRLFFDKETGYFEQVHIDCAVLDNAINVTPSPSQDTLYLTDYNLGPVSISITLNRELHRSGFYQYIIIVKRC